MFSADTLELSEKVLEAARRRGLTIAAAESCTGGLVAGALTAIAGSSDVFDRGFVTYSNGAKSDLLGVPLEVLTAHGAVSEPTARAMAEGVLAVCSADLAVAVTGVAGPGGGSAEKPVGLVWFAVARRGAGTGVRQERFGDIGRHEVRAASVEVALSLLLEAAERP